MTYINANNNKPQLCDVYMRKSNERDDRQVQSLETQEEIAKQIAKKYGLKIGNVYGESKSACKPHNRPQFDEMAKRIEKGKVDGIICWHLNRLSRNYLENGMVHQWLEDGKIKAIYTDGRVYTKDDDLVMDVEASMNARYSKDVMQNVRDGLNTKARNGVFPAAAPLGYANDGIKKTIVRDPDNWHKVRKLWDLMLTGVYSIPEIHEQAESMHIKTRGSGVRGGRCPSVNGIRGLFRNPFYYGYMKWGGKVLPAAHEAMVTKAEWDKVQRFLDDIGNKHNARPKKEKEETNALFRGKLLRCADCGCAIVTEIKKKTLADGSVKEYRLCRCSGKRVNYKCSWKGYMHEEDLLEQVERTLSKYTIASGTYKLALDALNEEDGMNIDKTRINNIKIDIERLKTLQDSLLDKNLAGTISDDVYKKKNGEFNDELSYLREEKDKLESPRFNWRELAKETIDFARYAKEDFTKSSLEDRRIILGMLGERLEVSPEGRTISFSPVKWLVPIEKGNKQENTSNLMVRTNQQQRKNSPLGAVSPEWWAIEESNL